MELYKIMAEYAYEDLEPEYKILVDKGFARSRMRARAWTRTQIRARTYKHPAAAPAAAPTHPCSHTRTGACGQTRT